MNILDMLDYLEGRYASGRWALHGVRQTDGSYRFWVRCHPFEYVVSKTVVGAANKRGCLPGLQAMLDKGDSWFDYYLPARVTA